MPCIVSRYRYTIYREPEHCKVLDHADAETVESWFWNNEPDAVTPFGGWEYLRRRLKHGKLSGFSAVITLPGTVEERMAIVPPESDRWLRESEKLCGTCKYWLRYQHRAKDGRLYGFCNKLNAETERCTWCMAKEDAG